jgi:hypothetical protein
MAINVDDKLKEAGVSEIKFYYRNCSIVGNIFTACLFFSKDKKLLARGVSICSVLDSHRKDFAREKSKSRAMNALFSKSNNFKISDLLEDTRLFTYTQKIFKIKNEEKQIEYEKILTNLGFSYEFKTVEGVTRLFVLVPILYPIEVSRTNFIYKSEYNPVPTEEEIKLFKLG